MCKKLMFLISFVFVLGMVTGVYADDYDFTNDYPWSSLYISPWNWTPTSPYMGPGSGDKATVSTGGTIVLDTDIVVRELRGPAYDSGVDQLMLLIYDCNLIVERDWRSKNGGDDGTSIITMKQNARVDVQDNDDDKSIRFLRSTILTITDNAELLTQKDIRFANDDDDYFVLDFNSGYMHVGYDDSDDGFNSDDGAHLINIYGTAVADFSKVRFRSKGDAATNAVNIADDAVVTVFDGDFEMVDGEHDTTVSVTDNAVIDVTDGDFKIGSDNDFEDATATLMMTGQLIDIDGDFVFPADDEAEGRVEVHLLSGVINVGGALVHEGQGDFEWVVYICGDGVMIVDGDIVDEILAQEAEGHWVACPEVDCFGEIAPHGTLMVSYDVPNAGKTTIWSEINLALPWSERPADGAVDVPTIGTELCWCQDESVETVHLYLGTDEALVAAHDPTTYEAQLDDLSEQMCYDPGELQLCTTYYWMVVTQVGIDLTYGPVWSFTTECCRTLEGFEDYDLDPEYYIWDSWEDGCGDVNGIGGNGTGSCVSLSIDEIHEGAKAMTYTYSNDAYDPIWERDANYSEATRTFDSPLDLTLTGEAALVAYFYGDPGNDLSDMWVLLNGVKATYGDNGEDAADIQSAEWLQWNMELAVFPSLDNVETIAIGFGDNVGNIADDAEGIVRFDNISVCPVRCVPIFVENIVDLNDDCITDMLDVGIFVDNWLEDLL